MRLGRLREIEEVRDEGIDPLDLFNNLQQDIPILSNGIISLVTFLYYDVLEA
jgi:hypothetical protein